MIDVGQCASTGTKVSSPADTKVALLFGGRSSERDISIMSAKAVKNALEAKGFPVIAIDTADHEYIKTLTDENPDVVFICLHGRGGEDGCVQGVCEELGLPYTGSGVLASALAMDKVRSKQFYRINGITTPDFVALRRNDDADHGYNAIKSQLGAKVVIKPSCEGSSFGLSIVDNVDDYDKALELAFTLDDAVLVERFVAGREMTVAILGNDDVMALPVLEIIPHSDFYDYEAKYAIGGSDHICPAEIPEIVAETCKNESILAHKALGCQGFSRTDLIVDAEEKCWVLETNTIPGMTQTSLIPDAASKAGIDFETLCSLIINLAL